MPSQITVRTTGGDTTAVNVIHFTSAQSVGSIESWFDQYKALWAANAWDNWSVSLGTEVRRLNDATGQLTSVASIGPRTQAGLLAEGTGVLVPSASQGLIRLSTGQIVNGRRLNGRVYVPGLAGADAVLDGNVGPALLGDLNLMAATFVTSGAVVWHRPTNGAGGVAADVTGGSAWSEFAVQRRRRSR